MSPASSSSRTNSIQFNSLFTLYKIFVLLLPPKRSTVPIRRVPATFRRGSRGRVQGVRAPPPPHLPGGFLGVGAGGAHPPPPEMTCGFLIQLVHPLLKKILDPPLTLEEAGKATAAACKKCFPSARRTLHS